MGIRVLVNGAFGRMGQFVAKAVAAHPALELAGQTGREYDLAQAIKDSGAQVVVDFTLPDSVYRNTQIIIDAGARPVIGTTGLKLEEIKSLQKHCAEAKIGGVIAPNFSLGAVLVMKCAREIAKYMPNVEIIETHHETKIDSPSGTAIRTAEMIAETIGAANPLLPKDCHESVAGARGGKLYNIPIHSVRLPGKLFHLEVIFGNPGESISLRSDSIDRQCYMPGVCLACEKVMSLDHLVYGLDELL
jgi:4-hydroxy-tetrahydrodipicolinate reductase